METCKIFEKTKSNFERWKLQCLRLKKLISINEKSGFAKEKINKLEDRAIGTMKLSKKTQREKKKFLEKWWEHQWAMGQLQAA